MKRNLTSLEVEKLIEEEDKCGVNDCLQQIFSSQEDIYEYIIGVNFDVLGDFNKENELVSYEVIKKDLCFPLEGTSTMD